MTGKRRENGEAGAENDNQGLTPELSYVSIAYLGTFKKRFFGSSGLY